MQYQGLNRGPNEDRSPRQQNHPHFSAVDKSVEQSPLVLPDCRPILSGEKLSSITTIEALRTAYIESGLPPMELETLIKQAKHDWNFAREQIFKVRKEVDTPHSYPVTQLSDGTTLIGISHSLSVHADVLTLAQKEICRHPLLLTEQGLGAVNSDFSHGIDIPDHFAEGFAKTIIEEEMRFFRGIYSQLRKLTLPKNMIYAEEELTPHTSEGKALEEQRSLGAIQRDTKLEEFSLLILKSSIDLLYPLPQLLMLAHQTEIGQKYTSVQKRSAYMAYFLKHWKQEETIEQFRKTMSKDEFKLLNKNKVFLCGAAHVKEIQFFSSIDVIDKKLEERAAQDAAILNRSVEEFRSYVAKRIYQQRRANKLLALAESLAAIGVAAWISLR